MIIYLYIFYHLLPMLVITFFNFKNKIIFLESLEKLNLVFKKIDIFLL